MSISRRTAASASIPFTVDGVTLSVPDGYGGDEPVRILDFLKALA